MRVVPFAAHTAIQSDCRTGYTSRNKMASFLKSNMETVRLAFSEKTPEDLSVFVEVLVSIMGSLSAGKWLAES